MNIGGDNPVKSAKNDLLGRSPLARGFAQNVVALDASEGLVVGVVGPWGSGKTTFINLTRPELKRAGIELVDFNPWMFSGSEQLLQAFFVEISAQLKSRPGLTEIGKKLGSYGEALTALAWLPVVGTWIKSAAGAASWLSKLFNPKDGSVGAQRERLAKALEVLDGPIGVILDDIDRLSTKEIRDVFRMVRLTASFPNIIYILAFDRKRVEAALEEDSVPGRDYLEKILQFTVDLPLVPAAVMNRQLLKAIDRAVSAAGEHGPFENGRWADVFVEIVKPLVRNMRDAKRYASSVFGAVRAMGDKVALVDLLGLEAIRVFLPDVFEHVTKSGVILTEAEDSVYGTASGTDALKRQAKAIVESGGEHSEVVESMIKRLFPGGQWLIGNSHYGNEWRPEWLRARRVAHVHVLRYYLEKTVGDGLQAYFDAEQAFSLMQDEAGFDAALLPGN